MVEHSLAGLRVAIAAPRRRAARPACGPRHRPRLGAAALGPPPPALLCARRARPSRISSPIRENALPTSKGALFYFFSSTPRRACGCVHAAHGEIHVPPSSGARHCVCWAWGRTGARDSHVPPCVRVSPDPRACCASYELLSSSIAPDAYTVREVMHLQLGWRGAHPQRRWTMSSATFGSSIHFRALTGWSRRALSRRHVRPRPLAPETGTSKYLYKSSAA